MPILFLKKEIYLYGGPQKNGNEYSHTGIVVDVDSENDFVIIIEAIGSSGSADERTNKSNGGDKETGATRRAVYKRNGGALRKHKGFKGYFRPKPK